MANLLGRLLVELGVNTAAFKSGLDKATYQAKVFADDLKKGLREVGSSFGELAHSFGELPAGLNAAVDGVLKSLDKLGAAAGPLGGVIGIAATAATALTAAAIGVTKHASEAADKIYLLSQATGVAIPTLSGLSAVAKTAGVDTESLARGLERMSRTALQASVAPAGTKTAYDRLQISVRDLTGQLKPTEQLFGEVANRFASMEDGAAKTAIAMQIFGRAGANLIPILNRGQEEINKLVQEATDLGAVLTDQAAANAHEFEESLIRLQLAGQGLQNRLMEGLAPSLRVVADEISDAMKSSQSGLRQFMDGIVVVAKYVIEFGALVAAIFHQIGVWVGDTAAYISVATTSGLNALKKAATGHFKEAKEIWKEGLGELKAIDKQFVGDSEKLWSDFAVFTNKLFSENPMPAETKKSPKKNFKVDLGTENKGSENIEERIRNLEAQANAEGLLANAIKATVTETIQATAAAKSILEIQKLEAAAKKMHTQLTDEQKQRVEEATLRLEAYKAALNTNSILEKGIVKTRENIAALHDEAVAYSESAQAIVSAQQTAKLEPYKKQVNDLQEAYDDMARSGKFSADQLLQLKTALEAAKSKLEEQTKALHDQELARENLDDAKYIYNLGIESKELDKQVAAVLKGAQAMREYAKEKALAAFIRENPFLTADQIAQLRSGMSQIAQQEASLAAAQRVAAQNRHKDVEAEIGELKKLRQAAVDQGEVTLAYDAAIHQAEQQKIKDYIAELQATGRIKDATKAFFIEFANDAKVNGEKVKQVMTDAFASMNRNLAQMIVEGKANWRDFFKNLFEQIAEMVIRWIEAKTIMMLMDKLLGGNGKDKAAEQIASNAAQAASAAALAAANTLALTSAMFPPPAPEAMAAMTYGTGMAFAALASFDQGGVISHDMLAKVHKDEIVLPPDIGRFVKQAASGGTGKPSVSVSYSPNLQSLDPSKAGNLIEAHAFETARITQKAIEGKLRRKYGL